MIPAFGTEEFNEYLKGIGSGKIRHPYYDKVVEHAKTMGVHFEGEQPGDLLEITRPNETEEQKQYRLDIWKPVTLGLAQKIVSTVNRIFNKRFYKMEFPEMPSTVGEDETLQKYTREMMPGYVDVMNYVKEVYTAKGFSDPNAVIYVVPRDMEITDTERYDPIPVIIPSEQIADFKENDYFVFAFGNEHIKIVTYDTIREYEYFMKEGSQIKKWHETYRFDHQIGKPPIFRLGGVVRGIEDPYFYMSFVGGVAPHWDRVITMSSDLDANYIGHIFMERWEYTPECEECQGTGYVQREINIGPGEEGYEDYYKAQCKNCSGTGRTGRGPLGVYHVRPDAINPDRPFPIPPVDYVDKNTNIVELMENRIEKEKQAGLSSVNMEILNNVPAPESGVAKAIDRQDLDAFLLRYQTHVFKWVLPNLFEYITWWRYGETLGWSQDRIDSVQPSIEPTKDSDFSVLSLDHLTNEYRNINSREGGSPPSTTYIRQLEKAIITAKFPIDEMERKKNMAIVELQPFPGKTIDDLLTIANLPAVRDWMITKALHIDLIVEMAIENNEGFLEMTMQEKRDITDTLAQEMTETSEVTGEATGEVTTLIAEK